MKKNNILKVIAVSCALVLTTVFVMSIANISVIADIGLPNEDKYTAGDASIKETVKNLDIEWTSGKITVAYHDEKTVTLAETSSKPIPDDLKMLWWLDKDTLRVRYAKPKFFSFSTQSKDLTITLPRDIIFDDVKIDATSAELIVPFLQAETLSMDVTSGDIKATAQAKKIEVETTSGNLELKVPEDTETIDISSTSGDLSIDAAGVNEFDAESTSGSIQIKARWINELETTSTSGTVNADIAEAGSIDSESTSGNITLAVLGFQTLEAESTSGNVTLSLPEDTGFTAHLDTTSGDITYELPLEKKGGTYICGDGSSKINIDTTSGDIAIK